MRYVTLGVMNLPFTLAIDDADAAGENGAETPDATDGVRKAVDGVRNLLVDVDRRFSPFRDDSLVSRFQRGDRTMTRDEDFADVYMLSLLARAETDGLFDPYFRGVWDPTGLVKGWAVDRAVSGVLMPLVRSGRLPSTSINAGGDMLLLPRQGDRPWHVGIADPHDRGSFIAAMSIRSGAVATSGTSERGEHVVRRHHDVLQATVVAESLVDADVWATALLGASVAGLDRLIAANSLTAFLVMSRGGVRDYAGGSAVDPIDGPVMSPGGVDDDRAPTTAVDEPSDRAKASCVSARRSDEQEIPR